MGLRLCMLGAAPMHMLCSGVHKERFRCNCGPHNGKVATLACSHLTILGAKAEPFGTKDDVSKFHAALKTWREDVINGAEIKSTAFTKVYKITWFTRWFRVYKHHQMENTGGAAFWSKEHNASNNAWKARKKVRDMRTMLYRIEDAVSYDELEHIYLVSKETLQDGDGDVSVLSKKATVWGVNKVKRYNVDVSVQSMMVKVWGVSKVRQYDRSERKTKKEHKARWNTELLKAREEALNEAFFQRRSAFQTRHRDALMKAGNEARKAGEEAKQAGEEVEKEAEATKKAGQSASKRAQADPQTSFKRTQTSEQQATDEEAFEKARQEFEKARQYFEKASHRIRASMVHLASE